MRSFITGINGFIGSWLAETLVAAGDQVFGLSRAARGKSSPITLVAGDLTSPSAVADAVALARPDRVFHLGALSNIQDSFDDPIRTLETNVIGSLHLLEAVRRVVPAACFVSVGSSSEYGLTAARHALLSEDLPLLPTSPYAISKVTQGHFSRIYAHVHGLRSIHVRPFAVIGPRKTRDALSDFCRNVVAIERGATDRFRVGNVSSERDFIDVRDCVNTLVLVSEKGEPGSTYNLCNGEVRTLTDVLGVLRTMARRPFEPVQDLSRLRAADDRRIVGDPARTRAIGYTPRFSFVDTIAATLEYWRAAPPP
jgi:GDP-4-dehydro-6-deoxy-D-mannose reductase